MTTDEALEYCKRFDDPKLQSAMATDFSRAMGSVGALLALRTEIEALRGMLAEPVTATTALPGVKGCHAIIGDDCLMLKGEAAALSEAVERCARVYREAIAVHGFPKGIRYHLALTVEFPTDRMTEARDEK